LVHFKEASPMRSSTLLLIRSVLFGGLVLTFSGRTSAASTWYTYQLDIGVQGWERENTTSPVESNSAQSFSFSLEDTYSFSPSLPGYSGPELVQYAQASAGGTAAYNHLSALTSALATKSVGHYGYTWNNNGTIQSGEGYNSFSYGCCVAAAHSYLDLGWSDALSIQSSVLSVGTPVDLAMDWSLHSSFGITGQGQVNSGDPHSSSPWVQLTLLNSGTGGGAELDSWNVTESRISGTSIIHTQVGSGVGIGAQMIITTGYIYAYEPAL
jgi:hypothetical protein